MQRKKNVGLNENLQIGQALVYITITSNSS